MKKFSRLLGRVRGLTNAIVRFPLTAVFLVVTAVIIAISINTDNDYMKLILTGILGAFLTAAFQMFYERFLDRDKHIIRFFVMGMGLILTCGYYLIAKMAPENSMEIEIRTTVALLAIFFAFIWIPAIRNNVSFNESFMVVFKSFFHSLLYAAVIFIGCSLILSAIQLLIFPLSERAFSHMLNIVFVLFAPVFFLSLIPVYPGKKEQTIEMKEELAQDETVNKAASCPKFLEVLISYIIIPITEVFTLILVIYIIRNIRGQFWSNNLLEPMLVSYSISVILVFILSSRLENKFVVFYRKVFPKVLIPIVVFQVISSVLILRDTGVTHNRYFVILFGIYAVCSGVVMSVFLAKKNGILAAMLIGFCVVSIIPPIDAFTISRVSQTKVLKEVLTKNNMLENNKIIPNSEISDSDKQKITMATEYLGQMNYVADIPWIPDDFKVYEDFKEIFGFEQYQKAEYSESNIYVFLKLDKAIDISGYDAFTTTNVNFVDTAEPVICNIDYYGKAYALKKEKDGEDYKIKLVDENKKSIIDFNVSEIFDRFQSRTVSKSELSVKDATFTTENDAAKLTIIVREANIYETLNRTEYYTDIFILVQVK